MRIFRVAGWLGIFIVVGMAMLVGQAQPMPSIVEACATGAPCPANDMPPPPPPGGGTDQLLANGQPVKPGDSVRVSPGGKVDWEALCGFAARRIFFMAFGAFLLHNEDHVDAQLNMIAVGIAHLCAKHYGTSAVQAEPELSLLPADLTLELKQGAGRFTMQDGLANVDVLTETTEVRSEGLNDFSMEYDPSTRTTLVAVHEGSVDIQPTNSNLPSMTLGAGQQVRVTEDRLILGSGDGEAPTITSVNIPSVITIGAPTPWQVGFSDPDGDVSAIRFEQFVAGAWVAAGEFDPHVANQTQGVIGVQTTCDVAAPVQARVTLLDAAGNQSAPWEYRYECVESSPPPQEGTIGQALDVNHNNLLDGDEVGKAIQYWVLGQTVPGTDQAIDDPTIRRLIKMWILGEPVSAASAAQAKALPRSHSLDVQALQLSAPTLLERELRLRGQGIDAMRVQVFDLSGRLLKDETSVGPQLRFSLTDSTDHALANGVYLYVVSVQGLNGQGWQSTVRKLVVMR